MLSLEVASRILPRLAASFAEKKQACSIPIHSNNACLILDPVSSSCAGGLVEAEPLGPRMVTEGRCKCGCNKRTRKQNPQGECAA